MSGGSRTVTPPAATLELFAGQWVYLDGGEPHSISGIEDTAFLLTILFSDGSAKATWDAVPAGGMEETQPADPATKENLDSLLDEGLADTFPASDPVSVSNPSTGARIKPRRS